MNAIQCRRGIAQALVLGTALTIAGCVAPSAAPPPPREVVRRPAPPPPPPLPVDWRDAPASTGDWTWSSEAGRSTARFGDALVIRCERAGSVSITRTAPVTGSDATALTIRTTDTARTIPATASTGPSRLVGVLPAGDPLLDAMAFSRGRFMASGGGAAPLYVPSWPEIGRVLEDCRQGS